MASVGRLLGMHGGRDSEVPSATRLPVTPLRRAPAQAPAEGLFILASRKPHAYGVPGSQTAQGG